MEMWELVSGKSLYFLALLFWASELFPNWGIVAAAMLLPWTVMSPLGFPLLPGLPATLTVVAAASSLTLDGQRLPSFPPANVWTSDLGPTSPHILPLPHWTSDFSVTGVGPLSEIKSLEPWS